jgi:hypothetical protein
MLFQQELFNNSVDFLLQAPSYTILYLLQIAKMQGRHRRAATPGLPAQGRYRKVNPAGPPPQGPNRRAISAGPPPAEPPLEDRSFRTAPAGPHRRVPITGPPSGQPVGHH